MCVSAGSEHRVRDSFHPNSIIKHDHHRWEFPSLLDIISQVTVTVTWESWKHFFCPNLDIIQFSERFLSQSWRLILTFLSVSFLLFNPRPSLLLLSLHQREQLFHTDPVRLQELCCWQETRWDDDSWLRRKYFTIKVTTSNHNVTCKTFRTLQHWPISTTKTDKSKEFLNIKTTRIKWRRIQKEHRVKTKHTTQNLRLRLFSFNRKSLCWSFFFPKTDQNVAKLKERKEEQTAQKTNTAETHNNIITGC